MVKILSRVGLVAAAVSVFPGCLEYALIEALKEDAPDEAYPEAPYYDDETSYDASYQEPYVDEEVPTEYDDTYTDPNELELRNASLAGDMGQVRGFADETPTLLGYDYGNYAMIEVTAHGSDGAAMAILQVQGGGLDSPEFTDGAHLQYHGYEYAETGVYMYLVGCSGPSDGNWLFDEGAEDLVVDVSVTPEGTTVLDFGATFTDGQTVVGSTEVGPLQAQ